MRLPRLDVIFGLASPAVDILVKDTGVAELQVRDDEARVWPFRADFDARDDPLDAAPARSSVEELLEAAELAILGRSLRRANCTRFVLSTKFFLCALGI